MNIINFNWNITTDQVTALVTDTINNSKKTIIKIMSESKPQKIIQLLSDDINNFDIVQNIISILKYASPSDAIRKAADNADILMDAYLQEFNTNEHVYIKLFNIKNKIKDKQDLEFINKILVIYQRNGINLDKKSKNTLNEIKIEIRKQENSIRRKIIDNENNTITLNMNQLDGLQQYMFPNVKFGENTVIPLNRTNFTTIMKYASNSLTRKHVETVYTSTYNNLFKNLANLIVLRNKMANILSYDCYSDYKSHIQMTKNSTNIKSFLAELLTKLDYRYKREIDTLNKVMEKEDNYDNVHSWDLQYYTNKWKQEYGVNDNQIREYFEIGNTTLEIFDIYQLVFDIKFVKINGNKLWANEIVTYHVVKDNKVIGVLYLDLFARNGKCKQTRCYPLQNALDDQIPVIALVSSIQHNLLYFNDVINLFHEFAHVMHHIFGKTKHSILSGLNVESDFVETPAHIFDLLCWEKEIIKKISKHCKTSEKLPDKIINKLIKIKNLDIGIHYKKHILVALFDQIVYSSDEFIAVCEDLVQTNNINKLKEITNSLYKELHNDIMIAENNDFKYILVLNESLNMPIEWISNMCGAESQYYSFIWSRVLSADIYNSKFKGKQLNKNVGNEFINKILSNGGSVPAYDMICNYMNKKPSIDGFINMFDLDTEAEYSFFLNTDQVKNELPQSPYVNNKKTKYKTESESNESVENRFTEIQEFTEIR